MCGILCTIIHNRNPFLNEIVKKGEIKESNLQFSEFYKAFKNRGPDYYNELRVDVSSHTVLQLAGSILWTQGSKLVPQPKLSEEGNVLLWNGDIFSGPLAKDENDTESLFEKLSETSRLGHSIPNVFASIRGPYSFIYYESATKTLYFGRDIIGRHSLLIGFSQRSVTITSVANKKAEGFSEIPAFGIFAFNLKKDGETALTLYPWAHLSNTLQNLSQFLPTPSQDNIHTGEVIPTYLEPPRRNSKNVVKSDLELWLVQDQDCSVNQFMEKLTFSDAKTRIKKTMTSLVAKPTVQIILEDLLYTLKTSVRLRVKKQPDFCKNCIALKLTTPEKHLECKHAKVAVLFSGGLDSAVLAVLAHEFVPPDEPIDLLNVAFEKNQKFPDIKQTNWSSKKETCTEVSFNVPDRVTGISTLCELKAIHPDRVWNFIEINVTLEELKKEREEVISDLIYPLNTVLDDSLGCALWFASRGRGILHESKNPYISPARIILSGIGADEQLGGYMRHRSTLKHKGGWEALDNELQFELRRISQRNLGRDDRIVSDHGRQLRMPYLDEDVINYLSFLPPWNRCFPVESMPPGLGDKLLLRLAAWELGLRDAANFPKRAMQFGSRIANSKEKGSDVSIRL